MRISFLLCFFLTIEAQRRVIELRKKQGYPTKEYETILEKMMEGELAH
jgi:hypothetical protein